MFCLTFLSLEAGPPVIARDSWDPVRARGARGTSCPHRSSPSYQAPHPLDSLQPRVSSLSLVPWVSPRPGGPRRTLNSFLSLVGPHHLAQPVARLRGKRSAGLVL